MLYYNFEGWRRIIRVGQIDCSNSENRGSCQAFGITAFPTIKFFPPSNPDPLKSNSNRYIGKRSANSVVQSVVDYIESHSLVSNLAAINESKSVIESNKLLVLVFENEGSYLGRQLILDCLAQNDLEVKRVLPNNKILVKHYSILELPTLVVQKQDGNFAVLRGTSVDGEDVAMYYQKKISEYVSKHIEPVALNKQASKKQLTNHLSVKKFVAVIRPTATDISSAVSYALRMEVNLHTIVSGSAFSALFKFVQVLEQTLQISTRPTLHSGLSVLRNKLDSRLYSGFVVVSDLLRVVETRLDQTVFLLDPVWESCTGSKPSYRGFPCGLWSLMHTATILSLTNGTSSPRSTFGEVSHFNTREVLNALVDFVRNFFSCEPCRQHFSLMANTLKSRPLSYDGDAILWLWEAHNMVNQRLQDDISSDPEHPKFPFPPHNLCPYCYISTHKESQGFGEGVHYVDFSEVAFAPGENLLQAQTNSSSRTPSYLWNRTAVFLFLYNFYIPAGNPHHPLAMVLQAAWPRRYPLSLADHRPIRASRSAGFHSTHPRPNYDVSIIKCLLLFSLIAAIALLLFRKRWCHHLLRLFIIRKVSLL